MERIGLHLREVKRVEEEDEVLTLVVIQGDIIKGAIDDSRGLEGGSDLSNRSNHDVSEVR